MTPPIVPPVIHLLPAGSTRAQITGLMPNTQYTFSFKHVTPAPHKNQSPPLVVTVTTAPTQATAATPTNPTAVIGSIDDNGNYRRDGQFGLVVTPTEFPSTMVLEVAVETEVGSNTPGPYAIGTSDIARVSTAPIVNLTRLMVFAPDDKKQRWVRAFATRPGLLQSPPTTPIAVSPWGNPAPVVLGEILGVFTPPGS